MLPYFLSAFTYALEKSSRLNSNHIHQRISKHVQFSKKAEDFYIRILIIDGVRKHTPVTKIYYIPPLRKSIFIWCHIEHSFPGGTPSYKT